MIVLLASILVAGAVLFFLAANLVGSAIAWLLGLLLPKPR